MFIFPPRSVSETCQVPAARLADGRGALLPAHRPCREQELEENDGNPMGTAPGVALDAGTALQGPRGAPGGPLHSQHLALGRLPSALTISPHRVDVWSV